MVAWTGTPLLGAECGRHQERECKRPERGPAQAGLATRRVNWKQAVMVAGQGFEDQTRRGCHRPRACAVFGCWTYTEEKPGGAGPED